MSAADATGFPRAARIAGELVVLPRVGSTNDEAVARVAAGQLLVPLSAVVTLDQRAGHGRLGRQWVAPPGGALAASVVVRLRDADRVPLLPLVCGAAMCAALRDLGVAAELKWPNDVLVGGAKICGILCVLAGPGAVVCGSGVNVCLRAEDAARLGLHGAKATALNLEGSTASPDDLLAAYLVRLRDRLALLERDRAAAIADIRALSATLGRRVRVELPDRTAVFGTAADIAEDGALEVSTQAGVSRFLAGDVTHLRPVVE